jgi:ATP-dependent Clp protease adaptor protein ClpS
MADVATLALLAAGASAWGWRRLRRPRQPRAALTGEAEIALHVAAHEAAGRALSSFDVLFGLLQDDAIVAAIRAAAGDPAAVEDRLLARLASPGPADRDDLGDRLVAIAAAIAGHGGRAVTCADLWAQLATTPAGRWLAASAIDPAAVLHAHVHGGPAPDAACADGRDVLVVLRNDHHTPQALVCAILRDVFDRSADDATAIMLATHTTGRGVVGRFPAAIARDQVPRAQARARAHGAPLWIGVEPT